MGKGIPIHVLGTSFAIQTDESPEYVGRLVSYVSDKIKELEGSIQTKDTVRLAVLASILIADELFKERSSPTGGIDASAQSSEQLGRLTEHMIANLDAALDEQAGSNP